MTILSWFFTWFLQEDEKSPSKYFQQHWLIKSKRLGTELLKLWSEPVGLCISSEFYLNFGSHCKGFEEGNLQMVSACKLSNIPGIVPPWTPKNWCLPSVVLEKTPQNLLDSKEIKPVNLKGDQLWIFTGRTDAEAKAPVFWSSDSNRQHSNILTLENCLVLGKIEGRRRRRHQRIRWLDWCHKRELVQTLGNGEGQGSLDCCSPWGDKQSDTTGWLKNSSNNLVKQDKVQRFVLP